MSENSQVEAWECSSNGEVLIQHALGPTCGIAYTGYGKCTPVILALKRERKADQKARVILSYTES